MPTTTAPLHRTRVGCHSPAAEPTPTPARSWRQLKLSAPCMRGQRVPRTSSDPAHNSQPKPSTHLRAIQPTPTPTPAPATQPPTHLRAGQALLPQELLHLRRQEGAQAAAAAAAPPPLAHRPAPVAHTWRSSVGGGSTPGSWRSRRQQQAMQWQAAAASRARHAKQRAAAVAYVASSSSSSPSSSPAASSSASPSCRQVKQLSEDAATFSPACGVAAAGVAAAWSQPTADVPCSKQACHPLLRVPAADEPGARNGQPPHLPDANAEAN